MIMFELQIAKVDPLEKHFGEYRQLSGGRIRVCLREVQNSEKIWCIKSLIKADVNSWDERVKCDIIDQISLIKYNLVCSL